MLLSYIMNDESMKSVVADPNFIIDGIIFYSWSWLYNSSPGFSHPFCSGCVALWQAYVGVLNLKEHFLMWNCKGMLKFCFRKIQSRSNFTRVNGYFVMYYCGCVRSGDFS